MALADLVAYEGTGEAMEISIPAFGSGYTISDMVTDHSFRTNDIMEFSTTEMTPGTPSDILTGHYANNGSMVINYAYAWPLESEVKNGVTYGITAERTGTYTGSGSSGYSRGRVING